MHVSRPVCSIVSCGSLVISSCQYTFSPHGVDTFYPLHSPASHCGVEIICLCCMQHKQEEADEVKRRFAEDSRSDHIALLRAFEVRVYPLEFYWGTCLQWRTCTYTCISHAWSVVQIPPDCRFFVLSQVLCCVVLLCLYFWLSIHVQCYQFTCVDISLM